MQNKGMTVFVVSFNLYLILIFAFVNVVCCTENLSIYSMSKRGCKSVDVPLWTTNGETLGSCFASCHSRPPCLSVSYNVFSKECHGYSGCPNVCSTTADIVWNLYCKTAGYIGCFQDCNGGRTLDGPQINDNAMTVGLCAQKCKDNNYLFYGVEYRTQCFCGNHILTAYLKRPDSECNMQCAGNQAEQCGGNCRINIYT